MTHSHDTSTPAMSAETVPSEEFVLVPREPTERMLKAADGWTDLIDAAGGNTPESRRSEFRVAWRAMIDAAPAPNPSPAAKGEEAVREALDGRYNIEAIAKVISLSYGENPEDEAPLSRICGPNNEPMPCWMAYEEQAEAVWIWMQAVLAALSTPTEGPASQTEGMGGDAFRDVRLDSEKAEGWPAAQKALWRVVTGENLNDGHYINAYRLTEKLYAAIAALTPPETVEAVPDACHADDVAMELMADKSEKIRKAARALRERHGGNGYDVEAAKRNAARSLGEKRAFWQAVYDHITERTVRHDG